MHWARLPLSSPPRRQPATTELDDGTCCDAGNSEGPQTLLKAPATFVSSDGLKADLRLDLQYRRHPNEAWQPIDKDAVVATHGRDAHVFVVREDFGSVAHVHGSWEASEFILGRALRKWRKSPYPGVLRRRRDGTEHLRRRGRCPRASDGR